MWVMSSSAGVGRPPAPEAPQAGRRNPDEPGEERHAIAMARIGCRGKFPRAYRLFIALWLDRPAQTTGAPPMDTERELRLPRITAP